jgi:Fe-S-cluster containining protein
MTWKEHDRLSENERSKIMDIKLETDDTGTMSHPYFLIEKICPFLSVKGMTCTLFPDWFYTCATYPFLLMPDGTLLHHRGCKGIGKGDIVNIQEMKKKITKERKKAGMKTH